MPINERPVQRNYVYRLDGQLNSLQFPLRTMAAEGNWVSVRTPKAEVAAEATDCRTIQRGALYFSWDSSSFRNRSERKLTTKGRKPGTYRKISSGLDNPCCKQGMLCITCVYDSEER